MNSGLKLGCAALTLVVVCLLITLGAATVFFASHDAEQSPTIHDFEFDYDSKPAEEGGGIYDEQRIATPEATEQPVERVEAASPEAEAVRRVAHRNRTALASCLTEQERDGNDFHIMVSLEVDDRGRPSNANVASGAATSPAESACLTRKLRGLRFPAAAAGTHEISLRL